MQTVVSAIKSLLDASVVTSGSPLSDIKKVFFGDPVLIPENDLPAIAVQPVSTEYEMRGSRYDQKLHTIEIRLVYNAKQYFGKSIWSGQAITAGAFSSGSINFTSTAHGLSAGDNVIVSGITPEAFNWTFKVASVSDSDHFAVSKLVDPWIYVSGWSVSKATVDKVFAVEDAIQKVELTNVDHSTAALSVCGTIQSNSSLPYSDGAMTRNAAEIAKIRSVNYSFSENRWFPTFEVVTTVEAKVIGDR